MIFMAKPKKDFGAYIPDDDFDYDYLPQDVQYDEATVSPQLSRPIHHADDEFEGEDWF